MKSKHKPGSLGVSRKKNEGGLRSQLRAMQRSNRRYTGGNSLDGKHIRPRDERIKRNHMQTVNFEYRMHHSVLVRANFISDPNFVPVSFYK